MLIVCGLLVALLALVPFASYCVRLHDAESRYLREIRGHGDVWATDDSPQWAFAHDDLSIDLRDRASSTLRSDIHPLRRSASSTRA
jgi:hypothetical protein